MTSKMWFVAAVGLVGCGSSMEPEAPAPKVLITTEPASAEDCAFGGSIVSAGQDRDANGVLDSTEVRRRTVVCNEMPGPRPATLVRLTVEPGGVHCVEDGTAVLSGPDRNDNGQLDDDEVEHIDYVCDQPLLSRLAPEPAGERCVGGGVAFEIGRDRDDDGALGDDEVEARHVECGTAVNRDVEIRTAGDMAALANISSIAGSLRIDPAFVLGSPRLTDVALPALAFIGGSLTIENQDLERVSLPALVQVGGTVEATSNFELTSLDLPSLRRVGGLTIESNHKLVDLTGLLALTHVDGRLRIGNNHGLDSAKLRVEHITESLSVAGNRELHAFSLALQSGLHRAQFVVNDQMDAIDLTSESPDGIAEITLLDIAANERLTHVAVRADRFRNVAIRDNPELREVEVGAREAVHVLGDVELGTNGATALSFLGTADDIHIEGSLVLSGPLTALRSNAPLTIGGDCTIAGTDLDTVGEAQLTRVAGTLTVVNNPRLPAIEWPNLVAAPAIHITGNPELRDMRVPSLREASIDVFDNPRFPVCAIEAMFAAVHGDHHQSGNDEVSGCSAP